MLVSFSLLDTQQSPGERREPQLRTCLHYAGPQEGTAMWNFLYQRCMWASAVNLCSATPGQASWVRQESMSLNSISMFLLQILSPDLGFLPWLAFGQHLT